MAPNIKTVYLSPAQFAIARLVASGYANTAIVNELALSYQRVTSQLHHIYVKLGIESPGNRSQRVLLCLLFWAGKIKRRERPI